MTVFVLSSNSRLIEDRACYLRNPWQMTESGIMLLGLDLKSCGYFSISLVNLSASLEFFTTTPTGVERQIKLPVAKVSFTPPFSLVQPANPALLANFKSNELPKLSYRNAQVLGFFV